MTAGRWLDADMIKCCSHLWEGPVADSLHNFGLLGLRVWLGLSMLVLHGWGKLQNHATLSQGFPDPLGVGPAMSLNLAIFAEVFCPLLVVVGLATRLALLPLVATMAVAFFLVHGGVLSGEGNGELAFIYLGGFLALLFTGPGRFALDHYVIRVLRDGE